MDNSIPETRQSSISVTVRVRPFTEDEQMHLIPDSSKEINYQLGDPALKLPGIDSSTITNHVKYNRHRPQGIRKIIDCIDDKMLIFDPAESNPLTKVSESILGSMMANYPSNQIRRRSRRNGEQKFVFDKLFDCESSQDDVYQSTTRPLLDSVLDGFNSTVFAYGATGCGKTYTISGTPQQPGIIFLTMQELFQKMDDLKDIKIFELRLSYLEIYNETIRDLLKPDTLPQRLVIREDSNNKIFVSNLSYHTPNTVQEVMDLVIQGNMNRTTSPTDANSTSSRSHAVLQIHVIQSNRTSNLKDDQIFATLSIIDLAGSERASATKNRGERLHEGANINRSLLALGNCINALCMTGSSKRSVFLHVPYRDSKLTRLLKFSLGGNCKTVMVVCISPSSLHYDETLNTLKYANRAKEIKTKVIRNYQSVSRHVGSYLKMITEQKQEIEELRNRESKIVTLELKKFKVNREKLQLDIWESINQLKANYTNLEKFKHLKTMKSLILCKRRFLQMILFEIDYLKEFIKSDSQSILDNCLLLQVQIANKIKELETKFDQSDELESAIEHWKSVELIKFQNTDAWQEELDLPWYEQQLESLFETIRNEILINSSIMMEKLLQDDKLKDRYRFISLVFVDLMKNENIDKKAFLSILHSKILDLIHIDDEFDEFASQLRPISQENKRKSNYNDNQRKSIKLMKSLDTTSSLSTHKLSKSFRKLRWLDINSHSNCNSISQENSTMILDEEDEDSVMMVTPISGPKHEINIGNLEDPDVSMPDIDKSRISLTSTALRTK